MRKVNAYQLQTRQSPMVVISLGGKAMQREVAGREKREREGYRGEEEEIRMEEKEGSEE